MRFYLYAALIHDFGVNEGEFSLQAGLKQRFVSCSKSGTVARVDQFVWSYGIIHPSPDPNKTGNVRVTEDGGAIASLHPELMLIWP